MITNFKQYNEGIKHLLVGPTIEEVLKTLDNLSPEMLLDKSFGMNFLPGVKKAVEYGANIHVQNDMYLRYGASRGYYDIVKFIIEGGVEIDILHQEALRFATIDNNYNMVKLLLENGSRVDSIGGKIALKLSKERKYTDIYELLNKYYNNERSKKKWWKNDN